MEKMEKIERKYKKISCSLLNISESKYNKDMVKEAPPLIYNFLHYFSPTYIKKLMNKIESSKKYLKNCQKYDIFIDENTKYEQQSEDEKIIQLNNELNLTIKENESELDVYNRMKKFHSSKKMTIIHHL